jgi:hypothetical protein
MAGKKQEEEWQKWERLHCLRPSRKDATSFSDENTDIIPLFFRALGQS